MKESQPYYLGRKAEPPGGRDGQPRANLLLNSTIKLGWPAHRVRTPPTRTTGFTPAGFLVVVRDGTLPSQSKGCP